MHNDSHDIASNDIQTPIHWVPSPAKLNLFLHINGRYENGYHQLQSLFQLLDVGDEIGVSICQSEHISLATPIDGVVESDNLVVRAAKLLQTHTHTKQGCQLYIKKKLPMGGGIGGGSSNAASVLVLLNRLWSCHLSLHELAELGLSLGADVPIFVMGQTAFAEGVGDILMPMPQATRYFLVATPPVHVSTAIIFQHPDLPRNTTKISTKQYLFENTRNDCQTLVTNMHPQVANLLQWLINYAPSRMTGTGASVFSVFNTQEDAENVLKLLPNEFSAFVARGVNQSPLHTQLGLLY